VHAVSAGTLWSVASGPTARTLLQLLAKDTVTENAVHCALMRILPTPNSPVNATGTLGDCECNAGSQFVGDDVSATCATFRKVGTGGLWSCTSCS
jgi:hypothetical protein